MCEPVSLAAGATALGSAAAAAVPVGAVTTAGLGGVLGTGISASTLLGTAGALGSFGLSALGKTTQYQDQSALYIRNAENANIALTHTYNANSSRMQQEQDKVRTDNFDVVKAMAEAKGKANASAGESGVGGVSFQNVMSNFEMKEGGVRGNNDANYAMTLGQISDENESARSRTKAVINSTPLPSETGMWAGIAADGAKAALKIYDIWDKDPPK